MLQQVKENENTNETNREYRPVRLSLSNIKRLQKRAVKFGDSYDVIVGRCLDYLDGKEIPCSERSW